MPRHQTKRFSQEWIFLICASTVCCFAGAALLIYEYYYALGLSIQEVQVHGNDSLEKEAIQSRTQIQIGYQYSKHDLVRKAKSLEEHFIVHKASIQQKGAIVKVLVVEKKCMANIDSRIYSPLLRFNPVHFRNLTESSRAKKVQSTPRKDNASLIYPILYTPYNANLKLYKKKRPKLNFFILTHAQSAFCEQAPIIRGYFSALTQEVRRVSASILDSRSSENAYEPQLIPLKQFSIGNSFKELLVQLLVLKELYPRLLSYFPELQLTASGSIHFILPDRFIYLELPQHFNVSHLRRLYAVTSYLFHAQIRQAWVDMRASRAVIYQR